MNEWKRIAGSLYARLDTDGQVSLREWDSPRAPVWTSTWGRIMSAIEDADGNVTFGGRQGDAGAVTIQGADLGDLVAWMRKNR